MSDDNLEKMINDCTVGEKIDFDFSCQKLLEFSDKCEDWVFHGRRVYHFNKSELLAFCAFLAEIVKLNVKPKPRG